MFSRIILVSAFLVAPLSALNVKNTLPEYNDPCPFGYGTNCPVGGQIDAAAKAQVVEILEAILSKLSSPEDQVVQLPVDMSKDTEEAIKALLAKLQGTQQAAEGTTLEHKLGEYFGADGDHSVDPEHNEPLARVLEETLAILAPPTPPPTPVQPVVIGVLVPGGSRLYKTDDKPTVAQTDMAAKVGSPSVLMGVSAFVFFGFAFLAISGLIYARSNMNRRSTRAITVQDPFVQDLEEDIE